MLEDNVFPVVKIVLIFLSEFEVGRELFSEFTPIIIIHQSLGQMIHLRSRHPATRLISTMNGPRSKTGETHNSLCPISHTGRITERAALGFASAKFRGSIPGTQIMPGQKTSILDGSRSL